MPARVDFYIVAEPTLPYRFVCRLTEKARDEGYGVYIHAASAEQAATIDDLLWTFRDTSFLPHQQLDADTADTAACPVLIGCAGRAHPIRPAALINLSDQPPAAVDDYERIIEIAPSEPGCRNRARARYKRYRDQGLELHSHNMVSDDVRSD